MNIQNNDSDKETNFHSSVKQDKKELTDDDYEGIISYLKTAYELAPESSKAQAIQDAITYFETVLEKTGQRSAE